MLVKRLLDVTVAAGALTLGAPILAGLAALVRADLGAPILFRQQRPGHGGRPFTIIKFRTMRDVVGPDGKSLSDAERLTPFGRWLRATSLDELPELWNVLVGDMSLVGPRPLLMAYLDRYDDEQRRRHDVPPGITGWTQINGRNALDWARKLELDIWYVKNWSNLLDLRILARTVLTVLRREGISHESSVTMPEFMGTATRAS